MRQARLWDVEGTIHGSSMMASRVLRLHLLNDKYMLAPPGWLSHCGGFRRTRTATACELIQPFNGPKLSISRDLDQGD